jgi:hypothetical protein
MLLQLKLGDLQPYYVVVDRMPGSDARPVGCTGRAPLTRDCF